ncbi:MAG: tRNA preQ1(34) S-adenosylmethionine ribosyltransferase-isomerase QueA [Deltaproteobacteria bacterium]|nr:tRNA preQ1(34) S-adenosylmethionine ribosyltransferase-isomerase QueA [Deltaproteobacteria bacterium]
MQTVDLDYSLPRELIAQEPLTERDASRLLFLDRAEATYQHRLIRELPRLIAPSLIVLNDTRVIPARIFARKASGGRVEFLLLERVSRPSSREMWLAMSRASKGVRPAARFEVADGELQITVERREGPGRFLLCLCARQPVEAVLSRCATVPLPPYIRRPPTSRDSERYQTIYARNAGAVAAPTAGLHLSKELMVELESRGCEFAFLTLHVGPGTFTPIRSAELSEHTMHSERFEIPAETFEAVRRAKKSGRQVLAVGTTVVRVLESACRPDNAFHAGTRQTSLFIYPPYRFQVVDALLTNFHLPRSTLLAMVMAFAGIELIKNSYAAAVEAGYRFFSYGDAMLIQGSQPDSL